MTEYKLKCKNMQQGNTQVVIQQMQQIPQHQMQHLPDDDDIGDEDDDLDDDDNT